MSERYFDTLGPGTLQSGQYIVTEEEITLRGRFDPQPFHLGCGVCRSNNVQRSDRKPAGHTAADYDALLFVQTLNFAEGRDWSRRRRITLANAVRPGDR